MKKNKNNHLYMRGNHRYKNYGVSAFTLIEMIIYIAVSAIMLSLISGFMWNIIDNGTRIDVSAELIQNGRLVTEKFSQQVHAATDLVTTSSTFNSHPGVLYFDMPGTGTDVIIDSYTKQVSVGGNPINIRKIRMKEGSEDAVDLTSDKVNVTSIIFRNFTRDEESANINLEFDFEYVNPGNDSARDKNISLEYNASLRKN